MTFTESFAFADCAARLLAAERPAKDGSAFLRSSAVTALRALWNSGDRDARLAVVARVHLWLGTDDARRHAAYARVSGRKS